MVSKRRAHVLIASLLAFLLVPVIPVHAQATTYKETFTVPYDVVLFNECTGEDVALTGTLQITIGTTIDADGGIHARFVLLPQQVRGVGLESGTHYKAVGGAQSHFTADADFAPLTGTNTSMFNLVSQDGTENLQARFTFHVTVTATGEVTAEVDKFRLKCVG